VVLKLIPPEDGGTSILITGRFGIIPASSGHSTLLWW
jgi:hypothetical protein